MVGRDCPKADGLISKELPPEQKEKDYDTRIIISEELGHAREEITVQYLGRQKRYTPDNGVPNYK